MINRWVVFFLLALLIYGLHNSGNSFSQADEVAPAESRFSDAPITDVITPNPLPRWWRGNLHTHTYWSDGDDFPEMVAQWYRTHDYQFLAISDHNVQAEGIRWVKFTTLEKKNGEVALEKYLNRFGPDWVESKGDREQGTLEIRLKPFSEYRSLVEERGKFLMIPSEEITGNVAGLPVHLNATNIAEVIQPLGGETVREAMSATVRAVQDQAKRKGREIIVHLNHPNYGMAVTAEDLAAVVSERFFEVYNGVPDVGHLGDTNHPSVERLWDIANTIRIGQLHAPPLYGVATDDSHTYHGKIRKYGPGRGWIMVLATHLTAETLVRAIKQGDFYASSGVSLQEIKFTPESGKLAISIIPQEGAEFTTTFIGTLADSDQTATPRVDKNGKEIRATQQYSPEIGQTLATVKGLNPSFQLTGKELYVRAVVTSNLPHHEPSFKDQKQQAWTQPVGWKHLLEE